MNSARTIGVTVLPEYYQYEGVDAVLDRLQANGVNAVTTSPYAMQPTDEGQGGREPPIDAGAGKVRLLDRPLWGRRELWVRTSPSFQPQTALYRGLVYQPPQADELTRREGSIVATFLDAAKSRGLRVYFQVQAAIPPGYRVQFGGPVDGDLPRLPDGRVPAGRVANNASLASPDLMAYQQAMIQDLCQQYPQLDGIRFDWPEYPPYRLDSIFVDFCDHAMRVGQELGYDMPAIRKEVGQLYQHLHRCLTDKTLDEFLDSEANPQSALRRLRENPYLAQWLRLKSDLSTRLLQAFRQCLDQHAPHVELLANAFPYPWNELSGLDYARAAESSQGICVKLYGMHWAMMLRFYGEQLLQANAELSSGKLANALIKAFDVQQQPVTSLDDIFYPDPQQAHPGSDQSQTSKIQLAQQRAGSTPVTALAHGYGPADDFRRRLQIANRASTCGIWLNRYGYLSDEKLAMLGES